MILFFLKHIEYFYHLFLILPCCLLLIYSIEVRTTLFLCVTELPFSFLAVNSRLGFSFPS